MRKSLLSLLGLIAFWSLFYAGIKYYFWWVYEAPSFAPTLEQISGFVLLGSMIAYAIGGALYARYSERVMLLFSILIGVCFFIACAFLPLIHPLFFDISMVGIWLSYSLYVIGKNTLIGREISTSKLGSSAVGAYTTIVFIVFLIIGTIIGAKIWENSSLHLPGIGYFIFLLWVAFLILLTTNTRKDRSHFIFSLALYKRLFLRYGIFMIGLACFWQISVEASQVAITYSKEFFDKSNSASSLLLIFSSIGAIIGNIISVKIANHRLRSFLILGMIFTGIIFLFSTILSLAKTQEMYFLVQILAFLIWLFFGGSVNLAESHFFSLLWEDIDKDYTSALYGFTLSLVGAITMFLSGKILEMGSYMGISLFLWCLCLIALYGGWRGIQIKK